jgi:hypothetical protein
MKAEFTLNTNIGRLCDQSPGIRYAFHHAQVTRDPEQAVVYVTATDGRGMAIVEADGYADGQCLMPASMSPSRAKDIKNGVKVTLNGQWVSENGNGREEIDPELRFPSSVDDLVNVSVYGHLAIKLDTAMLAAFAAALNRPDNPHLTVFIDDPKGTIVILGDRGIGVLAAQTPLTGGERGIYSHFRDRIIKAYKAAKEAVK